MIEVINRELLIPREEYNIGTCYDDNTETRYFHLKRVTSGGVDLAALTFNLDIQYADGNTDAASLVKEVTDKDINLVLTINNSMLQVPGTVLIQIRALDEDGVCKWTSYKSAFFVEDHINTPGHYEGDLTQLEQYEAEWGKVRDNVNQLNLRMDEVVRIREESPATEVEEEVIDARVGADNVVYDSLGSAIRKQVANEAEARIAAASTEATTRANAITAEATARANADTAEATTRANADNTLQNNINSEASTRAANDASLQSQINQIVAPSGEAPSVAEVENARIGADGMTYSTLGDAIRTNDGNFKGQINEIYNGIELRFDKTVSGTKYVIMKADIPAGTYHLSIDGIASSDTDATTCAMSFNNGSSNFLSLQLDRTSISQDITLTDDAVELVFFASDTNSHSSGDTFTFSNVVIKKEIEFVKEFQNTLESISGNSTNLLSKVIKKATITSAGTVSETTADYDVYVAPVELGKTYIFDPYDETTELKIGFYASDPTYNTLSYNGSRINQQNNVFTAPINGYVGIRYTENQLKQQIELGNTPQQYVPHHTAFDFEARRSIDHINTEKEPLINRFWSYAMTSVLCIGDSLTRGSSPNEDWGATTGTVPLYQNYPYMLKRMLECDVLNAGFSGISPTNWYLNWADTTTPLDDKPYKVDHYDFAKYDTFLIWLGTNVTNGQLDPDDIDVSGTDTYYYTQIIDAILTDYATGHTDSRYGDDCLIVLMTLFGTAQNFDRDKANSAIQAIATRYSLPVVDCSDLSQYDHPELHENRDNVHFGKAGYIYIANRVISTLANWFAENPRRTDYGQTQFDFSHY